MTSEQVVRPVPPQLSGYLMKLKRKTTLMTSNWNKRWFFVDTKRREFGYSKSKDLGTMACSIHLDEITAVVAYDDYQFQVESRQRNFFLKGESLRLTSAWVHQLDAYRLERLAYEKAQTSTRRQVVVREEKETKDTEIPAAPPSPLAQPKPRKSSSKSKSSKKTKKKLHRRDLESLPVSAIADLDDEQDNVSDDIEQQCGEKRRQTPKEQTATWKNQFSSDEDEEDEK